MANQCADRAATTTDAQTRSSESSAQRLQDEVNRPGCCDIQVNRCSQTGADFLPAVLIDCSFEGSDASYRGQPGGWREPQSEELDCLSTALRNPQFRRLVSDASGVITMGSLGDLKAMENWLIHVNPSQQNPFKLELDQGVALKAVNECFYTLSNGTGSIVPNVLAAKELSTENQFANQDSSTQQSFEAVVQGQTISEQSVVTKDLPSPPGTSDQVFSAGAVSDGQPEFESYYPGLDLRELKIWDNGYSEVTGLPHYTDDGGENDPGAPQLASIFGDNHSRKLTENNGETQDFPKMTRMLRLNDPYNPNADGSLHPSDVAVSAFGLATEVGENIYLPKSSQYTLDSSNKSLQGRVIFMDRASGELAVAYHNGDFGDGYNIYIRGIKLNDSLKLGELINVDKQALGTATGEEILVSMRDRHTFFDNRFIHHWWNRLTRHP